MEGRSRVGSCGTPDLTPPRPRSEPSSCPQVVDVNPERPRRAGLPAGQGGSMATVQARL